MHQTFYPVFQVNTCEYLVHIKVNKQACIDNSRVAKRCQVDNSDHGTQDNSNTLPDHMQMLLDKSSEQLNRTQKHDSGQL